MRRVARAIALAVLLIGAVLGAAYLYADGRLRTEEPAGGTIPTGQLVYVDDGNCPNGQVTEVTGSVPGVDRPRRCVVYPYDQLVAHRMVAFIERRFGKLFNILAVLGTIAGGIAAVLAIQAFLTSKKKP